MTRTGTRRPNPWAPMCRPIAAATLQMYIRPKRSRPSVNGRGYYLMSSRILRGYHSSAQGEPLYKKLNHELGNQTSANASTILLGMYDRDCRNCLLCLAGNILLQPRHVPRRDNVSLRAGCLDDRNYTCLCSRRHMDRVPRPFQ